MTCEYSTKIGEYCATHENWVVELASEPYNLKIKFEDGFVIFNYNQLSSDFNNEIVREARGIIFKNREWEHPVCHAFDKFGNYGESYVPDMDWSTVKCTEKIDGSIMKLWCCDDTWHVSTNGNIDAKAALVPDVRANDFDELFWDGIRKSLVRVRYSGGIYGWLNDLDKNFTYIFELVSPYTRVVIPYEYTDVYFLGARNNRTGRQCGCDEDSAYLMRCYMFPRPKLYDTRTLEDILKAAQDLPWDEEGYVCYDKDFNRCKIKSPKYVLAHFARNNNVITRWHLIDIILKGEMDEFIIYASDYKDQIEYVKKLMDDFVHFMDACALMTRNLRKLSRPEAAEVIKKFHKLVQNIMFMNLDRLVGGREYTYGWDTYKWERALENYTQFLVRGPENDL